jgi:hypothetical protein
VSMCDRERPRLASARAALVGQDPQQRLVRCARQSVHRGQNRKSIKVSFVLCVLQSEHSVRSSSDLTAETGAMSNGMDSTGEEPWWQGLVVDGTAAEPDWTDWQPCTSPEVPPFPGIEPTMFDAENGGASAMQHL